MKKIAMLCCLVWAYLLVRALPAAAETVWSDSLGSYAKNSGEGDSDRGLLMLKPLDEGCVLFDLSVSEAGTDNKPGQHHRVAGIFFVDEEQRGVWENKETGETLIFSKYRQRVTVRGAEPLSISPLAGKYDFCSGTINGNALMLEKFIGYLPLFKTGLSARGRYQVRDVSDNAGEYCKLVFIGDDGQVKAFLATPALNQILRVEGDKGIIIYQENSEQPQT
ncbi:MAG: hypothetical protein Q4F00_03185 [bacterium]|nr:hypothetical protein [bacterium]